MERITKTKMDYFIRFSKENRYAPLISQFSAENPIKQFILNRNPPH